MNAEKKQTDTPSKEWLDELEATWMVTGTDGTTRLTNTDFHRLISMARKAEDYNKAGELLASRVVQLEAKAIRLEKALKEIEKLPEYEDDEIHDGAGLFLSIATRTAKVALEELSKENNKTFDKDSVIKVEGEKN